MQRIGLEIYTTVEEAVRVIKEVVPDKNDPRCYNLFFVTRS